ncbi:DinB superfamily protein [Rufibacter radiotolerans]|uniref:DinB superfamily protein n=1 Tax=Rufibacter radiotolerans TaxID=1379910 RepID=A0A0H4VJE6_9BACT|nr:DinB family protein [Rufibacter radiotolerans]AKQ45940.1 DinB superfamily protein [Rufibacter radiotolerans]
MTTEFTQLFSRDLDRLQAEIQAFRKESNLWMTKGDIKNSAGNLCLHLMGNLRTYIGRNMGSYAYVRDRDAEFALKDIPAEIVLNQIKETKALVVATLTQMAPEDLEAPHKEEVFGYAMSNRYFLLHLLAHLSYHLGQINYLRRVLEE